MMRFECSGFRFRFVKRGNGALMWLLASLLMSPH